MVQDYPNFEVIVSDNASTDGTINVVEKYKDDPRFRYYRNDKNLGGGVNYENLLYKHADGQYGKYLTDDDYLIDREHLSKAMHIIQKYNVKVVFSAAINKFEEEDIELNMSLDLDEAVDRQWWIDHLCTTYKGFTIFPSCMSGNVFEIENAKKLNAFKLGQYYHDYEFAIKCILMENKTGYIKEPSYVERRHSGQDGRTSFENALKGTQIFNNIYTFGIQLGIDEKVLEKLRRKGFRFFIRGFLLQNWVNEHGNSPGSLWNFLVDLKKVHKSLPIIALTDIHTIAKFFSRNTPIYDFLRKVFLQIHKRK
jgi:glycosyltransferase involved in cell wall biosynthesis